MTETEVDGRLGPGTEITEDWSGERPKWFLDLYTVSLVVWNAAYETRLCAWYVTLRTMSNTAYRDPLQYKAGINIIIFANIRSVTAISHIYV